MEKIRTSLTKENLSYINSNNMSVTRLINIFIEKMRIEDALKGKENELRMDIQTIIRESQKQK